MSPIKLKYVWAVFNPDVSWVKKDKFSLVSDARQDKEHPEVDPKDQDDLEDDLPHHSLSEVEGPVHHHGAELDQDHDQEGSRHLVLRQWRGNICRWVFLKMTKKSQRWSFWWFYFYI